jgi:hypothetical protein
MSKGSPPVSEVAWQPRKRRVAQERNNHQATGVKPPIVGCLIIVLLLILATMLAGPFGFLIALVLILAWALVTGSVLLLWNLLLLPFRLLNRLFRSD